jgi:hypothetical protein
VTEPLPPCERIAACAVASTCALAASCSLSCAVAYFNATEGPSANLLVELDNTTLTSTTGPNGSVGLTVRRAFWLTKRQHANMSCQPQGGWCCPT